MEKLNQKQISRLVEIINEHCKGMYIRDIRSQARETGCSMGYLSQVRRGIEGCTLGHALEVCRRLGANPYYVLEGKGPKYADWRSAFYHRVHKKTA